MSVDPPPAPTLVPGYRRVGLILGAALFAGALLLPAPDGMSPTAWRTAAMAALMAVWWASEAVPVAATALLPLVLVPVLGIGEMRAAAAPFANPLIFLFLGGFVLALAMQRWNLHRRIALLVIGRAGTRPGALIGGFMAATAFLSMWVSNTATTMMMLAIAVSVVGVVLPKPVADADGDDASPTPEARNFATALMLGIAYAASIGGVATLIGTPPNALLAAFLAERDGTGIGFARWMAVGLPISIVLLPVAWFVLVRVVFPCARAPTPGAAAITDMLGAMGPPSPAERRVAAVFAVTALLWIGRPLLGTIPPLDRLSDPIIAIAAALALFLVPAGAGGKGERLMNWDWARRLPWGTLILFGGGLSLANAVAGSGLAAWIGTALAGLAAWPVPVLVLAVAGLILLLTELTSNTATTATFLPVVAALAMAAEVPALLLLAPAALAASCAFMLPVATPPNAIVHGSGHVTLPQMMRAGIWLNVAGLAVVTAAAYWAVIVFLAA
ncbi:MAG: SLC13 family permease [Alphaproteobacteria bacterium]